MLNNRSTFIFRRDSRKSQKGQVALFVALIFQLLFLFFAMVINIGLLVHHKINLQNSVDLAAYYGAMKQADDLNAVAHINYQVRQSWKLLAWRYRMLGSAGEWEYNPYDKTIKNINPQRVSTDTVNTDQSAGQDFQEAPAFCITYVPFKPMPSGENTCRYMASQSGVRLFDAPPLIAGFQNFSATIRQTSEALRSNAIQRCRIMGAYNYAMLGKFVVAFNIDQGDRVALISALSRGMSYAPDDFYDLDGTKVSLGARATFDKNLTSANTEGMKNGSFKMFNSLGQDGCNAVGRPDDQPAKWLTPIKIFPGFSYIDTTCADEGMNAITPKGTELAGDQAHWPKYLRPGSVDLTVESLLGDDVAKLAPFIGYRSNLNDNYNFSIGVEKNPWCMAYVGVSAQTSVKIPFSPMGAITLSARGFYKPFGGRMGPWFMDSWSRGSDHSNAGSRTDPLLPPRPTDIGQLQSMGQNVQDRATRAANFSRFVGDPFGLKTWMMIGYYSKAIYELDPAWRTAPVQTGGVEQGNVGVDDTSPNFAHWDHLPFNFTQSSGDILAWDKDHNQPSAMRNLELAAILPDPFDLAYYSIDPDFYHNYYLRIKNNYIPTQGAGFNKAVRPDIGYHAGANGLDQFSVKDQYQILVNQQTLNLPVDDKFTFMTKDWRHLLTGWADKGLTDYSLDSTKLGKCLVEPKKDGSGQAMPATSGNCVSGGSSGYSVKMVSSDYLLAPDLQLGGQAGGSGPLLNPPDVNF